MVARVCVKSYIVILDKVLGQGYYIKEISRHCLYTPLVFYNPQLVPKKPESYWHETVVWLQARAYPPRPVPT